ncbi:TorF family putative porin [Alteromonas sp. a30]|uniref:TorF family putative porin n=1 Tax=Alteromonas sp. a30 TaxID=2730917 RepID=UPI00227F8524|nr:TorF family putative porin [Alteromonas sp. a30]MCY7295308.1 hypothetical protein [Alteromonas sp. a30]
MKLAKICAVAAVSIASLAYSHAASAALKAGFGVASEHHFRGVAQTNDASANINIDWQEDGFYVGAFAVDVNKGFEVDGYFGYRHKFDNGVGAQIGATTYQFTGDHSSTANELNLGLSYGIATVDFAVGKKNEDIDLGIPESDYTFVSLTLAHNGFFARVAGLGNDFEGEYFQGGYMTNVAGFDVGVTLAWSGKDLDDDESLLFSIRKTFEL